MDEIVLQKITLLYCCDIEKLTILKVLRYHGRSDIKNNCCYFENNNYYIKNTLLFFEKNYSKKFLRCDVPRGLRTTTLHTDIMMFMVDRDDDCDRDFHPLRQYSTSVRSIPLFKVLKRPVGFRSMVHPNLNSIINHVIWLRNQNRWKQIGQAPEVTRYGIWAWGCQNLIN